MLAWQLKCFLLTTILECEVHRWVSWFKDTFPFWKVEHIPIYCFLTCTVLLGRMRYGILLSNNFMYFKSRKCINLALLYM